MVTRIHIALALLACSLACNELIGIDGDYTPLDDGSGGETGSGGESGDSCDTPGDCADPGTCMESSCVSRKCVDVVSMRGTPCTEDGGQVCDGSGQCVECVSSEQCNGGNCNANNNCSGN